MSGAQGPAALTSPPSSLRRRIFIIAGLVVAAGVVSASFGAYLASPPTPIVHVSGFTFEFTYTDPAVAAQDPLGGGWSWSGGSPYPLSLPAGTSGEIGAYLSDNLTTNCTVWSISTASPFVLENLTVRNNATHWVPGALPTTILGKIVVSPGSGSDWFTLLNLEIRAPGAGGTYSMPLYIDATC